MKVPKILNFRKAVISNCDKSLGELLREALALKSTKEREQNYTDDGKLVRVINRNHTARDILFGEVIQYDKGSAQLILRIEDTPYYDVSPLFAESLKEGTGDHATREFVNAVSYFGIQNNNVIVMAAQGLSVVAFEKYLNWLLIECTGILDGTSRVTLKHRLSLRAEEALEKSPVKSVELGSRIGAHFHPETNIDFHNLTLGQKITNSVTKELLPYFRNLMSQDALEDILESKEINLKLILSYKGKMDDDNGKKLLNKVCNVFRKQEEEDFKAVLDNGVEIKGDEIVTKKKVSIERTSEGELIVTDIYDEIHNWFCELADQGLGDE